MTKITLWMMMNCHEPINEATWSATRSPIVLFSIWTTCQGFRGRMGARPFQERVAIGNCRPRGRPMSRAVERGAPQTINHTLTTCAVSFLNGGDSSDPRLQPGQCDARSGRFRHVDRASHPGRPLGLASSGASVL